MRHTLLSLVAIAAICFASCNNSGSTSGNATKDSTAQAPKMSKEERNMATIKRGMEYMNAHDADKMKADASADFTEYFDGTMPAVKGDSAWMMFKQYMAAFPDMKAENTVLTANGDYVMAWSTYTGTFKGDMMGIKATNKSFKCDDVDIFKFDDSGKVVSHRNIYPAGAMMMQCGVDMSKMMPPSDKKDMKKEKGKM